MTKPDKELWDKVHFNPERYEYIPIPNEVAKIIVRKKDDKVLLAHFLIEKDEKILFLHYVREDCGQLFRANGGYSCSTYDNVKEKLIELAKCIAEDYPEYKVKKRKRTK